MPEQGVATVNYVVQLASSSSTLCASYRVELGSLDTICMHLLLWNLETDIVWASKHQMTTKEKSKLEYF